MRLESKQRLEGAFETASRIRWASCISHPNHWIACSLTRLQELLPPLSISLSDCREQEEEARNLDASRVDGPSCRLLLFLPRNNGSPPLVHQAAALRVCMCSSPLAVMDQRITLFTIRLRISRSHGRLTQSSQLIIPLDSFLAAQVKTL